MTTLFLLAAELLRVQADSATWTQTPTGLRWTIETPMPIRPLDGTATVVIVIPPAVLTTRPTCAADLDADSDVDLDDYEALAKCYNGPNRPARCER